MKREIIEIDVVVYAAQGFYLANAELERERDLGAALNIREYNSISSSSLARVQRAQVSLMQKSQELFEMEKLDQ